MNSFSKEYSFKIENDNSVERLTSYLTKYHFKLKHKSNSKLIFLKKFSLLEGWKINPISWESEIVIYLLE